MSERQEQGGAGREVTPQIKALAGRCVTEGLTAAEITDISDEVRADVAAYLRYLGGQAESGNPEVSPQQDAGQDIVEEDSRLKRFVGQYQRFSAEDKVRCPWANVRARLLNNNGRYLAFAEGMNLGGILFGVDKQGNPLFADVDKDPKNLPHCGLNYPDTRNAVYLKDPQGEWVPDNMTGYEMFPYDGAKDGHARSDKSFEIMDFERFTGEPFVVSPDRREFRSSWLESGENPKFPRYVEFVSGVGSTSVDRDYPLAHSLGRGVRRLLRVKES